MKTPAEIQVFVKKTSFMQRCADLVRTGHATYIQGEIPLTKAAALVSKFERRYPINLPKMAASRVRAGGGTTARMLLLYQESTPTLLSWVLLIHPGQDFDPTGEHWRAALKDRLTLTGYELVRKTRPDSAGPAWTWKYTREQHDALRAALVRAIRTKRDDELRQLIDSLWRTPGFAGAREQVKKFADLIRGEWERTRGNDIMPEIPKHLGYVQRLKDTTASLASLLAPPQKKRKARPIPTEIEAAKVAGEVAPAHSDTKQPEVTIALFDQVFNDITDRDVAYWSDDETGLGEDVFG